jgi:hypothetical protein
LKNGFFGFFECNDHKLTYQELTVKSEILKAAHQRVLRLQGLFVDDSGNWFLLEEKEK